jgi:magnesium transporter
MAPDPAVALIEQLDVAVAALLLRGLSAVQCADLLRRLPSAPARSLGLLLQHPEGTAGAVMDPDVLALPEDLTAEQAVARVRQAARGARYNLYIIDREQRLVGVINQRELLLAPADSPIASFMERRVHRLRAEADAAAVVSHPAWREVNSLPVVDRDGRYLGAIRYRAFRALEESLRERIPDSQVTAQALGDLFRTGAAAVLELLAPREIREGGTRDGR